MQSGASRRVAAIALITFVAALASRPLFSFLPGPWGTLGWKIFWVLLCLLGIRLAHHTGLAGSARELGLCGNWRRGALFATVASLPMLAVFAFTTAVDSRVTTISLVMTIMVAPFTEELLFRGYLFLQLYRRAKWSFSATVGVSALAFGLAHYGTLSRSDATPLAVLAEMAFIAAGGAFYAWLLIRWEENLWVAIFLHGLMNLWCAIFGCDRFVGGAPTLVGRVLTVFLAVVLTLFRDRLTPSRKTIPSS